MDSISITAKKKLVPIEFESTLGRRWQVGETVHGGLVVNGPSDRVYLFLESAADEHGHFKMFLDYTSVELVKEVLKEIADDPEITVDNDFGTVLPGNKFVERIRSEPNWNWRGRGG
jgi:hypothetical protein